MTPSLGGPPSNPYNGNTRKTSHFSHLYTRHSKTKNDATLKLSGYIEYIVGSIVSHSDRRKIIFGYVIYKLVLANAENPKISSV